MSATHDFSIGLLIGALNEGDSTDKNTAEILSIVLYARGHRVEYGVLWDLRRWRDGFEKALAQLEANEVEPSGIADTHPAAVGEAAQGGDRE